VSQRDSLFLQHILDAIGDIENFVAGGRDVFMTDRKTQSAVVRQLEIIGEATKNLSVELTTREAEVPWRQIAGARDRLIHAYFSVDLDAVWSTIQQDLPALRANVARILATRDQPAP
jgi:uncharacterized protein with HEPN domain